MSRSNRLVVDPIHGDIHLAPHEWQVVNTASFQRLRYIKQVGMGHFTYPNATHTRFAHSLGVFGIMCRVLEAARPGTIRLDSADQQNLRLAALLHDIGHYPYSHVMETLDTVVLTEEMVDNQSKDLDKSVSVYPGHEQLGALIVTNQEDLIRAIGTKERAKQIADLFTRSQAANPQLSKLIHSSLDMDRLDYLLRDSRAAGVPYGSIDIDYILNNLMISQSGMLGVSRKALPAAEQFLMARHFMHRAVYYHKTTVAMEEACRQMLRRLRDRKDHNYGVPRKGDDIEKIVTSAELPRFTDGFIDGIIQQAARDSDPVVRSLAAAVQSRTPPRLLKEVCAIAKPSEASASVSAFMMNCKHNLLGLANRYGVDLRRFLFWKIKPLQFEERGAEIAAQQARALVPEHQEEAIKVFAGDDPEPMSIMDVKHSVMRLCAGYLYYMCRLYLVCGESGLESEVVARLSNEVREWDRAG